MPVENEHLRGLLSARRVMVEARREAVLLIADPAMDGRKFADEVLAIQLQIDAIDSAIKDEENIARPGTGYTARRL